MIIVEDVGIVGRVREVVYREKVELLMRGLEEVEFEVKKMKTPTDSSVQIILNVRKNFMTILLEGC